jgi:GntR family transcriptional regulator
VTEPMYRQIAEDLQHKIESSELGRGTQLPTEIDLREQYGASRNTVRDAIKWLVTRGLVETRPGQGTFVTERITPFVTTLTGDTDAGEEAVYLAEVAASSRTPTISPPRVEIQQAAGPVASALWVEEGTPLVSRHQERFIDGTPWSLQTSFYLMSLVLDRGANRLIQATDIPEGAVTYLANECGIAQVSYRDSIAVRAPDEIEAAFFKLPADGRVAVFVIFRVGFEANGNRFRLTITVYPADRNRFVINVGPIPPSQLGEQPSAWADEPAVDAPADADLRRSD